MTSAIKERRRTDLVGRIARATYPQRKAALEWFVALPCTLLGHKWHEVPRSLRGNQERMRFQCKRCSLMGGFSN